MSRTNFQELLDAGVHFGHLARKWNPKMAPYIFDQKNGIHVIDLHKTVLKIDEAAEEMKLLAKKARKGNTARVRKSGTKSKSLSSSSGSARVTVRRQRH